MHSFSANENIYFSSWSLIKSTRDREYDALAQITNRIIQENARLPYSFPSLAAALDDNRKLWLLFLDDVAEAENKLAHDLRGSIASLSLFIIKHSLRVLEDSADVSPIVDINYALMRGLSNAKIET